jgi:hypothetical protein
MFKIDRPFLGVIYTFTYSIFGDNPLAWQLFSLSLRILCSIVFLALLRQIWPNLNTPTTLMAILFSIYPGFMQQPIAVTFSNHFIGLFSALLSLLLTIFVLKTQKKNNLWIPIIISLGFQLFYLFIYEYMIGFELARFMFIWFILFKIDFSNFRNKLFLWLKYTWYYFIPLSIFLIFRIFIFKSARQTTDLGYLLGIYLESPLLTLGEFVVNGVKGLLNTLIFSWFVPFYNLFEFSSIKIIFLGAIISFFVITIIHIFVQKLLVTNYEIIESENWDKETIELGLLFIIFTIFPIIISNREIAFRDLLDRYTLQSAFGAAMVVVGFLSHIFKRRIFFGSVYFLVILSIIFHFNNSYYWKSHWDYQKNLFWQLSWRAPQIKPDTVVLAMQPQKYLFREDEDFYVPVNLIFYPDEGGLPVVSEVLTNDTIRNVIFKETTHRNYRGIQFERDFTKTLLISQSNPNACVHIINGKKPELIANENPLIRLVANYSNIDQILVNDQIKIPPLIIFGMEPDHNWCYFYQKAELARQQMDWLKVISLWDEITDLNLEPEDVSELMPFLEASYALSDDTTRSNDILEKVKSNLTVRKYICENYDLTSQNLSQWEKVLGRDLCYEGKDE